MLPDLGEPPFETPAARAPTGAQDPIPAFLAQNRYLEAMRAFTFSTSIGTFDSDFARVVEPHLCSSFGRYEAQFCILELGLEALIQNPALMAEFRLVERLSLLAFDPKEWDTLIAANGGTHFPQILWSPRSSLWLKTRLMALIVAKADPHYAEKTLWRYLNQLTGTEPLLYLLRVNFELVAKVALAASDPDHHVAVFKSAPRSKFQSAWRRLKNREGLAAKVRVAALEQALELKLSYEVASILKRGRGNFSLGLLRRALLAVAWGQRQPPGNDAAFTTAQHIRTQNIVAVLRSIPEPTLTRVLYTALLSGLPPNILWALALAWEEAGLGPPSRHVYMRMAEAMVSRPHFEQLRYMALLSTPAPAISHLLKLNVQKVHRQRQQAGVAPETMIEDIDMKLFIGGMVLLSEKSTGASVSASTSAPAPTSTRPFGRLIDKIFTQWSPEQAQATIENLYKYHNPSPEVTLTMVAMLLRHKSYTQAVQLLHTQSTAELPPAIFFRLLLQVCSDFPQISTILTTWLTSVQRVYLPPSVLQRMVVLLSRQRELSDRQSMLRINSVLKLLRGQKASLGPDAAAAIVDGLLARAMTRPGGSRNRLQWALDLCKEEGVPQEKVKEWVEVINSMRRDGTGYWHKRGRNGP